MIEIAAWQDIGLPFLVEYARPAFERVRQRAAEGLIALPRVGMGVGGLLLGEHTSAGIRVTGTVELPCSHTLGPTFQLTPDEIRQSLELVKSTGAQRAIVGIYCTRTRGALALGATDRELFDLLCPESWQILFVLRPSPGEPTRAAVFFRNAGEVTQGTVKELWEWRPAELDDSQTEPSAPRQSVRQASPPPPVAPPAKVVPLAPVVIPMPVPAVSGASAAVGSTPPPPVIQMPLQRPAPVAPAPVKVQPAEPVAPALPPAPEVSAPVIPVAPAPKRAPVNPQFAREPRPLPAFLAERPAAQPPNQAPLRLLALAAAMVIVAVGGGMFATRDAWMPRPPLTLSCTDTNGMLEIHWNAAAARGLDHGSLLINDGGGGQLDTVSLDPLTLLSGSFLYKRKSDRVTVTLDLGNERARTAFPPEADGTGTASSPAAADRTLPDPPPNGAVSAFGDPPASAEPAAAAPSPAHRAAAPGK